MASIECSPLPHRLPAHPTPTSQSLLVMSACPGTRPACAYWRSAWEGGCCWWACPRRAWSSWSLM